jgi:hypothetical protein
MALKQNKWVNEQQLDWNNGIKVKGLRKCGFWYEKSQNEIR